MEGKDGLRRVDPNTLSLRHGPLQSNSFRQTFGRRHGAACAMPRPHYGEQLPLALADALMADCEPTQEHDLGEIARRQRVAQSAEHHDGDDVARQRRPFSQAVLSPLSSCSHTIHRNQSPQRRSLESWFGAATHSKRR